MIHSNGRLAGAYLAAFATGDPDAIADLVSVDFVNEHVAGLGDGCIGRHEYRLRLPGFLQEMVGLRYDIEQLIEQGPEVAAFYTMTARWRGETPITVRGVMRLIIADGLITHRVDYWDSSTFLWQVDEQAREALAGFGVQA